MNWLEHTRIAHLNPREVDLQDSTYCVPCFASLEPLIRSIEQLGIVNAPVVQERSEALPVPVLGRRRLAAAVELGMSRVEVNIIPADMSAAEGFALAFWDNLGHRNLDTAAAAIVVRRLLKLFPRESVASRFLPALGIPAHGPRIERLNSVGGLETPILQALASGRIQEKTAWILSKVEPVERLELVRLTGGLGLNGNKTHEVIAALFDLSVYRKEPIRKLLDQDSARSILSDHELPIAERATRFRELVRSWKYPDLVIREKEFRNQLENLWVSSRVSVHPAPNFESPQCTIEIRCESPEQAATTVARLRDDSMSKREDAAVGNT